MRSLSSLLLAGLLSLPLVLAQSAEDYLTQANQLIASYQWREAGTLLADAVRKFPGHVELELRQAHLLIRTGGAAQAAQLLERQLRLRPGDGEVLRLSGEAKLALGDYDLAADFFKKALARRPSDGEILHDLGVALLLKGDKEAALVAMQEAAQSPSPRTETRRLHALLLSLNGRIEESRREMKEAIAQEPENARLLFELSEARRIDGKYGEALEYADMAIEADPENPLYYSALARLYRILKQERMAEEVTSKASSLLRAFDLYAVALRSANQGDVLKAISTLEPPVMANPEFVTGKLLLADLEERRNHPEKALLLYQEALAQDPSRLEAIEKSAWIRTRQGEPAAALELLQGSSRAVQNRVLTRAYLYMTEGKWELALEQLQQVEMSYPLNHQLLKLISTCLQEQGRLEEASIHLERARILVPDDEEIVETAREIRLHQATRLMQKERWREAAGLFRRLASDDPDRSVYWLNLGYCQERSGVLEAAVTAYRQGLRAQRAVWAQGNLASCLTRLGRYSEAAMEWEELLKSERSGQSLLQLGLCYAQLDRHQEAAQVFQAALALGETSGELLYNLGVTKMRLLQSDEGWDYVRQSGMKGYQPARELMAKARSVRR